MKNICKITVFFLCLFLSLAIVFQILTPKDGSGIYDMRELYALDENSVDVLMLGSSLSFINIDPAVLWQKHGIAAYSLGGAFQPLSNSYYYLKEALRTQSPKLVTLEIFCTQYEEEWDPYYALHRVVAIRSLSNRWNAAQCNATPDQYFSLFWGFPRFHGRYAELSRDDFLPYRGRKDFEYYLGHGTFFKTVACSQPDVTERGEALELPKKTQEYLMKIISLCKENGIPLLLFASPTASYLLMEGYYQTVEQIALQSGVGFVDFNLHYDAIGIDFETDFADENHLNQYGCPKFSEAFGTYIAENYELEDHRGDARYCRWDKAERFYEASLRDYNLAQAETLQKHFEDTQKYAGSDLFDLVWVPEGCAETICGTLQNYGVPGESGVYRIENGTVTQMAAGDESFSFDWGPDSYTCTNAGMARGAESLFCQNGHIAAVVFDKYTMKMADAALYDAQTGALVAKPINIIRSWVGTGD